MPPTSSFPYLDSFLSTNRIHIQTQDSAKKTSRKHAPSPDKKRGRLNKDDQQDGDGDGDGDENERFCFSQVENYSTSEEDPGLYRSA